MTANICLGLFVYFIVPETRRVALEEVDVLFGGQNHIEKGANLLNIEDPRHAHIGVDNITRASPAKTHDVVEHADPVNEIK
jgi:hypothetical protein